MRTMVGFLVAMMTPGCFLEPDGDWFECRDHIQAPRLELALEDLTPDEEAVFFAAAADWSEWSGGRITIAVTPSASLKVRAARSEDQMTATYPLQSSKALGFSPPEGIVIVPHRVTSSEELHRVIAHEIGHLLGLGHNGDRTSLMYGTTTRMTPWDGSFSELDRKALQACYFDRL